MLPQSQGNEGTPTPSEEQNAQWQTLALAMASRLSTRSSKRARQAIPRGPGRLNFAGPRLAEELHVGTRNPGPLPRTGAKGIPRGQQRRYPKIDASVLAGVTEGGAFGTVDG